MIHELKSSFFFFFLLFISHHFVQFLGIEAIEISFEMRILLEIQIKYRFRAIREREGGREGVGVYKRRVVSLDEQVISMDGCNPIL